MNRTLGAVKTVVRSIMGDPDGDWLTDSYLNPMVNHIYNLQITYLSRTCNPFMTALRVCPGLPAGTTDLANQITTTPNGPLLDLRNPLNIDFKQAGQPDGYYRPAARAAILPDVNTGAPQFTNVLVWEWRGGIIYLIPLSYAIDIRVRGEFNPPALVKEESVVLVHPTLGDVLAEEVGACASRERGNLSQRDAYSLVATAGLDEIARELQNSEQSLPVRMGRATNRLRFR